MIHRSMLRKDCKPAIAPFGDGRPMTLEEVLSESLLAAQIVAKLTEQLSRTRSEEE